MFGRSNFRLELTLNSDNNTAKPMININEELKISNKLRVIKSKEKILLRGYSKKEATNNNRFTLRINR